MGGWGTSPSRDPCSLGSFSSGDRCRESARLFPGSLRRREHEEGACLSNCSQGDHSQEDDRRTTISRVSPPSRNEDGHLLRECTQCARRGAADMLVGAPADFESLPSESASVPNELVQGKAVVDWNTSTSQSNDVRKSVFLF